MNKLILLCASASLLATSANAQNVVAYIGSGGVGRVTSVSSANPLPTTPSGGTGPAPLGVTSTDASALTITLGGTYQTVFAASATRKACLIQNPTTATEVLSIKLGANASVYQVPAGSTFSCANVDGTVVQDDIKMTAATTAHAFAAVTQ